MLRGSWGRPRAAETCAEALRYEWAMCGWTRTKADVDESSRLSGKCTGPDHMKLHSFIDETGTELYPSTVQNLEKTWTCGDMVC